MTSFPEPVDPDRSTVTSTFATRSVKANKLRLIGSAKTNAEADDWSNSSRLTIEKISSQSLTSFC